MCALKTFNLDEETYKEFSSHCKSKGFSMSKKVDNFIREELERMEKPVYHKKITKVVREEESLEEKEHRMGKYC